MEKNMFKITSRYDKDIVLKVTPGHFATTQSHVTHHLDLATMKSRYSEAQRIAQALAQEYESSTPVDTIVCLDGLDVVGALLAQSLTKAGILSMNAHKTMYVIHPEFKGDMMMFRDNMQPMIKNKNIVILIGTITTGTTLGSAIQCIRYYDGILQGVSAIFSEISKIGSINVNALFTGKDLPGYESYKPGDCPYCQRGEKIMAIVNSHGYSKM
ncbi:MAG: orotate phosphoribosyltransferase [Lachnospiraceae bacterium]|nr:orotate phosphoribosyltransferase [Lachnospiraceae bacterium]